MWKSVTEWWNRDKLEIERLRQEVRNANECFDNVQDGLSRALHENKILQGTLQDKIVEVETLKAAAPPDMKADGVVEPWMIVEVNGKHDVKGLKVNIDWNEAMVQHMKDSGHNVRDENLLMQHFIVQLYEHVIQLLEHKSIEESDQHRTNEFE